MISLLALLGYLTSAVPSAQVFPAHTLPDPAVQLDTGP